MHALLLQDRQIGGLGYDRETDGQTDHQIDTQHRVLQTDRQLDKLEERQTDNQEQLVMTERQTDKRTIRLTNSIYGLRVIQTTGRSAGLTQGQTRTLGDTLQHGKIPSISAIKPKPLHK